MLRKRLIAVGLMLVVLSQVQYFALDGRSKEMTKETSVLVAVAAGRHFLIKRGMKNSTKG